MKHQMLNQNILTKDVTNDTNISQNGFEDKKQLRFKELEVVLSGEAAIEVGSIVKVKSTSGEKIELPEGEFIVIKLGEIIMVL